MKRALITGITGQDGAYLARKLLSTGHEYSAVYGMVRRTSHEPDLSRLDYLGIKEQVKIVEGDVTDLSSLIRLVKMIDPHEVYNLAAQSFVGLSWGQPLLTSHVTGFGVANVLEAVRIAASHAKVYQASSSEMFGISDGRDLLDETAPFHPRSPYGVAKVFGYWTAVNYRESFNMHVSNGILFNHESPLRGLEFVTRKITHAAAYANKVDGRHTVTLGNMQARRDWGHAEDYVDAMYRMLQLPYSGDYVIATGVSHSVQDVCKVAFGHVDIDWRAHVKTDTSFTRPADVHALCGDASKAKEHFKWQSSTSFEKLIAEMVDYDLWLIENGK